MLHQPLAIRVNFKAIVNDAVQKNHGVAVRLLRPHIPRLQDGAIRSREFYIAKFDGMLLRIRSRIALLIGVNGRTRWMQDVPAQANAADHRTG
jgi:hypothetical protein